MNNDTTSHSQPANRGTLAARIGSDAQMQQNAAPCKPKKNKRKRKKKAVPIKMTNTYRPAEMSLEQWQIALRKQAAEKEDLRIETVSEKYQPGEYRVTNPKSHKEYKVVYRGKLSEWNYCSCPDYKTSQLGTCKHLEAVKLWIKAHRRKTHTEVPNYTSVYVDYNGPRRIRIRIGEDHREELEALAREYFDQNGILWNNAYEHFDRFLLEARHIDDGFRCYRDALDLIVEHRSRLQRRRMMEQKYPDESLDRLLTVGLYPYQKEGVQFALRAGKCIIADEMGLGKTIQAICSAEIYLREGLVQSVLIVCPTSLKYQWKREIEKFTGGDRIEGVDAYIEDGRVAPKVIVIEGNATRREQLYQARAPYKIVSYHAMANDIKLHGRLDTDLLIMDEVQRLKNWNTQIAQAARRIESRYAVLLSGTPLENKLEELYSIVQLVDPYILGPYYLFRNDHILTDTETGATVGYKGLNAISEQISQTLLRRTKKGVRLQLPSRSDQYLIVPMTEKQQGLHDECKDAIARLVQRWATLHFLSEEDRKHLMLLLGRMRMAADSTFILEQNLKTRSDVKIAEVINILDNVIGNGDEKVVIFSEWERMARLVAMELDARGIHYEFLHGGVPSPKRRELVENFTDQSDCRVFISTDAGSTGLNLQVASLLINLDLPWNPAILEQRIARIYRIGQQRPIQIINLVSKGSIEEGMIGKLRFKSSMFEGVLDGGDDMVFMNEDRFQKFMEDITSVMADVPDNAPSAEEEVNEEEEAIDLDEPDEDLDDEEMDADAETDSEEEDNDEVDAEAETESVEEDDVETETEDETVAETGPDSIEDKKESQEGSHPKKTADEVQNSKTPVQPQQLIQQGVSFLSGLAQTLQSPEATRQLVDNLVQTDEQTGETSIKIPVADKESVMQMFSLLGKLFAK